MPAFRKLKQLGRKLYADLDALEVNAQIVPPRVYVSQFIAAGAAAADYDGLMFIADRAYEVVQVRERHQTAGSSTTASVNVKKVPSGTAKASGTDIIAAVIDLSTTADTNQTPALHATVGNRQLAAGNAIGLVGAGTMTAVDGVTVQVVLKPI